MSVWQLLAIALAALVASAVNAVAGGGTFITFPTLNGIGRLSEKIANITSTLGLWPGSLSSAAAARQDLKRVPRGMLVGYGIISFIGGAAGALLLLWTSSATFGLVIPWLLGFATLLFACGKRIGRWAAQSHSHGKRSMPWLVFVGVMQLGVGLYGGYFGAGIGVLMLGGLSFTGLEDLHQINALKVLLAMLINGVACVIFLCMNSFSGPAVAAMAVSSLVGGFAGMAVSRRIPQKQLRAIILCVGIALTAYYFYHEYFQHLAPR